MRARLGTLVTIFGLSALTAACGGGSPAEPSGPPGPGPQADTTTITIPSSGGYGESSFSPGSVTVPVGRRVTWRNSDTFVHTTTSDTGVWTSQINANGDYSRTFTTPGSFNYRCTLHPGMTGNVTVQ